MRSCKKKLFNIEPNIPLNPSILNSLDYHRVLINLLLLKFRVLVNPCKELVLLEEDEDIDPWFELCKRYQQYPEEDIDNFSGTFFLDWSKSKNIALFFANEGRTSEGALWICDAHATGKTLQEKKIHEILKLMDREGNQNKSLGTPLLFYPPKQIHSQRANNQEAIYFAQMDLRYDLAQIWRHQETQNNQECIYIQLILPDSTQGEVEKYLCDHGITKTFIYPDQQSCQSQSVGRLHKTSRRRSH